MECITVSFPDLVLSASDLQEYGGFAPRTEFEIEELDDGTYYCYYSEMDDSFEAESVEKIAEQIKDCLEGDPTVSDTGEYEITRTPIDEE